MFSSRDGERNRWHNFILSSSRRKRSHSHTRKCSNFRFFAIIWASRYIVPQYMANYKTKTLHIVFAFCVGNKISPGCHVQNVHHTPNKKPPTQKEQAVLTLVRFIALNTQTSPYQSSCQERELHSRNNQSLFRFPAYRCDSIRFLALWWS